MGKENFYRRHTQTNADFLCSLREWLQVSGVLASVALSSDLCLAADKNNSYLTG